MCGTISELRLSEMSERPPPCMRFRVLLRPFHDPTPNEASVGRHRFSEGSEPAWSRLGCQATKAPKAPGRGQQCVDLI
jgi:hypothetical protein